MISSRPHTSHPVNAATLGTWESSQNHRVLSTVALVRREKVSQGGQVGAWFLFRFTLPRQVPGILGCKGTASDIELGIPRESWGAPHPSGQLEGQLEEGISPTHIWVLWVLSISWIS